MNKNVEAGKQLFLSWLLFGFVLVFTFVLKVRGNIKAGYPYLITISCSFQVNKDNDHVNNIRNDDCSSYWEGGVNGKLTVITPYYKHASGIMLSFYQKAIPFRIEDINQRTIQLERPEYLTQYYRFDHPLRIFSIAANGNASLQISRLWVLGRSSLPRRVQRWKTLQKNADILLVVAHPDDELVFFGGLLPVYAGQLQKAVVVAYTRIGNDLLFRKNEALDALWECGVRYYPELPDGANPPDWKEYVTAIIRKYRPKVVITHDLDGEYHHYAHIRTADCVIQSVKSCSVNQSCYPASAQQYGTWVPQKLYVHLFPNHSVCWNWNIPLSSFNGRTAYEVASQAFRKHKSQFHLEYNVEWGKTHYSNCKFGLYSSRVGDDTKENSNDLLQHTHDEELY